MGNVELTFSENINISTQVGDTVYFSNIEKKAEFSISDSLYLVGKIKQIVKLENGDYKIVCKRATEGLIPNVSSSFIFFVKSNEINTASTLGYYAEVKFTSDSAHKSELYSVSCDVSESSK